MRWGREMLKMKRTGFFAAFIAGGVAAGAIPLVNMAFRSGMYTMAGGDPLDILMKANWQMIAMLNLFLVVAGSCILYHVEYGDGAMQRMESLPVSPMGMFAEKSLLLFAGILLAAAAETIALAFCGIRWYGGGQEFLFRLAGRMAWETVFLLPTQVFMLAVSSACTNLWISLGIGITAMFAASVLTMQGGGAVLNSLPFALPYETAVGMEQAALLSRAAFAAVQLAGLAAAETVYLKIRREVQ